MGWVGTVCYQTRGQERVQLHEVRLTYGPPY